MSDLTPAQKMAPLVQAADIPGLRGLAALHQRQRDLLHRRRWELAQQRKERVDIIASLISDIAALYEERDRLNVEVRRLKELRQQERDRNRQNALHEQMTATAAKAQQVHASLAGLRERKMELSKELSEMDQRQRKLHEQADSEHAHFVAAMEALASLGVNPTYPIKGAASSAPG